MKTVQEIKDEMKACKKTIKNYQNAFNEKRIPEKVLQSAILENESMMISLNLALDMKTEQKVRDEIGSLNEKDDILRETYKNGEIDKPDFRSQLLQNSSKRLALKWVLGENDRYD
ncbi:hypothetical protein [Bacillus sp. NPDC094106]|uniref:hypothetical protein n=1 Tax=Bacillus sp. NPDC094106 TaxID=3363949 RepID=UPI00381C1004